MTTKEIADFNEVTTKTVRRWVDKLSRVGGQNAISNEKIKMLEAGEKGTAVDWNEEEVYAIMTAGGRGVVTAWMKNAKPVQNGQVASQNAVDGRMDKLEGMFEKLLLVVGNLAIATAQTKKPELPAPKLAPRDELRMIVNSAVDESKDYSGAYRKLYTEIYYRLHINVTERAKNAKTGALDILEAEGLLESAVLIAREIFQ